MKKIHLNGDTAKKFAKGAYNRFDMCVSTMFSPFAGVLYTFSALDKMPPQHHQHSRSNSGSPEPANNNQLWTLRQHHVWSGVKLATDLEDNMLPTQAIMQQYYTAAVIAKKQRRVNSLMETNLK